MITLAAAVVLGLSLETVELERVFVKGEKSQYSVESVLNMESRQYGLNTFMPEDLDINYKFTTEVLALKTDGYCEMSYKRPTMTTIEGETAESPPKTKVDKVGIDLRLDVSPINEITKVVDLNPPKPPAKTPPKKDGLWMGPKGPAAVQLGQFTQEIFRLALFLGSLDSSLDFSPKLPFEPVKVGETWKRTVGYSPQALQGKEGKSAVQRLDYVFTYAGVQESGGKQVHRVTANLALDTDIGPFINQMMGTTPEQSGLKSMQLKLDATIDFDLDLKTRKTLKAVAQSKGGITVMITQLPNSPAEEVRLKGRTVMQLLK
jgi:hypothetical protein